MNLLDQYLRANTTFTTPVLPRMPGTTFTTQPIGAPTLMPGPPPPLPAVTPNVPQPRVNYAGRSGNPYLDPRSTYGGGQNLYRSPLSETAGRLNPQAEITRLLALARLGGASRMDQYAQSQAPRIKQAYDAAQLNNPFLTIRQFLGQNNLGDNLRQQFQQLTASQRGLNPQSRTSVVRWG